MMRAGKSEGSQIICEGIDKKPEIIFSVKWPKNGSVLINPNQIVVKPNAVIVICRCFRLIGF